MSAIKVFDINGSVKREIQFPDELLVLDKGEQSVHDAVVAFLGKKTPRTSTGAVRW